MEEAMNLPNPTCIPHLSTFLRDIIHVDSYFSENDANRNKQMEWIFHFLDRCQQSNYGMIYVRIFA